MATIIIGMKIQDDHIDATILNPPGVPSQTVSDDVTAGLTNLLPFTPFSVSIISLCSFGGNTCGPVSLAVANFLSQPNILPYAHNINLFSNGNIPVQALVQAHDIVTYFQDHGNQQDGGAAGLLSHLSPETKAASSKPDHYLESAPSPVAPEENAPPESGSPASSSSSSSASSTAGGAPAGVPTDVTLPAGLADHGFGIPLCIIM